MREHYAKLFNVFAILKKNEFQNQILINRTFEHETVHCFKLFFRIRKNVQKTSKKKTKFRKNRTKYK